jgi:photosystem II stability/assembly factor-like uncharacterized protein
LRLYARKNKQFYKFKKDNMTFITKNKNWLSGLLLVFTLTVQAQTWTASETTTGVLPNGYVVYGIKAVNDSVVWACASAQFDGSVAIPTNHVIKILRTTNGGQTWRVQDVTMAIGRAGIDIEAFDSTTAWLTANSLSRTLTNGIYKTTDGGMTWTQKLNNNAGSWNVRFFDKNNGVCVNDNNTGYTTDGGETWTTSMTALTLLTKEFGYILSGSNAMDAKKDTAWVVVSSPTVRSSRVFRTVDKGRSWQVFSTGIPTSPFWNSYSLAFKDAKNGLLTAEEEDAQGNSKMIGVAKTINGGETWTPLTALPTTYQNLTSTIITAIPNTQNSYMMAGTKATTTTTVFTTNGGSSWSNYYDVPMTQMGALVFSSPKVGWLGNGLVSAASRTALYKWNGGNILSATKELAEKHPFSISPNPSNGKFMLSWENGDNIPTQYLRVFNAFGQLVFEKKDVYNDTQIIDLQGFENGVYLVQLHNTEGVVGQKIVVQH